MCVAKVASHPPQNLSSTSFTLSFLSSQTQVQQQHTLLALPVQNQASGTCFAFHKFFFPPKNQLLDFFFLQHHQKKTPKKETQPSSSINIQDSTDLAKTNRPKTNKNLTKEQAIGERTKLKKNRQTWGDSYTALTTQEPLEKSKADGDATVPAHLQTRRIL